MRKRKVSFFCVDVGCTRDGKCLNKRWGTPFSVHALPLGIVTQIWSTHLLPSSTVRQTQHQWSGQTQLDLFVHLHLKTVPYSWASILDLWVYSFFSTCAITIGRRDSGLENNLAILTSISSAFINSIMGSTSCVMNKCRVESHRPSETLINWSLGRHPPNPKSGIWLMMTLHNIFLPIYTILTNITTKYNTKIQKHHFRRT